MKRFKRQEEKDHFHFLELPFSIQDRFIELQSPLTKRCLKNIYPWIKIDQFVIDKLHIDAELDSLVDEILVDYKYDESMITAEIDWKNISDAWNLAQSFFERQQLCVHRFRDGRKCKWNLERIKQLKVVKTAIFTMLKPLEFQHLYSNLNLFMISELEIKHSNLTLNELALIKNLNLKSIYLSIKLENGSCSPAMIEFIMQIFARIPKIRVFFDCFYDGNFFENLIVDWIIQNGYRESFCFTFRTHHFPWYLTFSGDSLIINGFDCYQLAL